MQKKAPRKEPFGRPTSYKPEYCQIIIELMSEGKSVTQVAKIIGVNKATLYDWKERYPEFKEALNTGYEYAQAWFEDMAQNNLCNRNFKEMSWKMQYHLRFERPRLNKLLAAKTFTEKSNSIIEELANGELDAPTAKLMVESIAVVAKIDEVTDLKARLDELERKQSDG